MWKNPVGLGAKRTRTWDINEQTERNGFAESPAKGKAAFVPAFPPAPPLGFDPGSFAARIEGVARDRGFRVEHFGRVDGIPQLALTRRTAGPRPRIYLSAGIHGDEPAPPLALLDLLEAGCFDERATWFICPLLNPAGFVARTRGNGAGLDLNRDYRHRLSAEIQAHTRWLNAQPNFDLALCLHEDWESEGFYLYEITAQPHPVLARAIVHAVAAVCPIEAATTIDGRDVTEPGIIHPAADPHLRDQWPESIYLHAHHTPLGYTLETPSSRPLAQRIAAQRLAITTALAGAFTPDASPSSVSPPPRTPPRP
ncbi:MAG: M14 family metallocarboxypeptidase [Opitutaceae bacterium]|nr:M14 family metallocarboxypeptidase [Opitutaceae bacterium]